MPFLMLKDLPRYECLLEAAKKFPDLDPSAAEVFLNLLRTGDEVFRVVENNFTKHGLSQGRFGVLMLLARSSRTEGEGKSEATCLPPGPLTPAELADAAGVTRATMTGLIDTLERDGFVKRESDPADRRMMPVKLTPKGRKLIEDILPGHFRIISAVMGSLNETERKTMVRLLNKILQQASGLTPSEAAHSGHDHRN
ncbi:MAG TPA: MarR family transcriptional regulator [Opitutaceae bacterium]|nr:MarR family transcriptional regulator [Opitutaceae bacterium]